MLDAVVILSLAAVRNY